MKQPSRWLAYFCLALSMALVGIYVAFSQTLVLVFSVFLLAWLRFGIAALLMLPWMRRLPTEAPINSSTHVLLFAESFFGNFLFSICMLYGVLWAGGVAAGVVMAAIPATVAMLSWLLLGERITSRNLLAIALSALGIAIMALLNEPVTPQAPEIAPAENSTLVTSHIKQLLGYLLLVVAVICEALYAVIGKRLTATLSPKRISALINAWGLALMTPFGLFAAWHFDFQAVHLSNWLLLVFYALAASIGSVWLWMTGLKHVDAAKAGIFTVMLPISASAIGALWFHEPFGWVHLTALGLGISGLILATLPDTSTKESKPT